MAIASRLGRVASIGLSCDVTGSFRQRVAHVRQLQNVGMLMQNVSLSSSTTTTLSSSPSSSSESDDNNNNNKNNTPPPRKAWDGTDMPPIIWTTHRLSKEQIEKVDAIFHKLLWLDMIETSMVTNLINEKLGRPETPKQRKESRRRLEKFVAEAEARRGNTSVKKEEVKEEEVVEAKPIVADLKLVGYDEKSKIKVIKEIRTIVEGLGLKEAKELVEGAPKVIHKGIKPELAEEYKLKLEAVGAKVEITTS